MDGASGHTPNPAQPWREGVVIRLTALDIRRLARRHLTTVQDSLADVQKEVPALNVEVNRDAWYRENRWHDAEG
jgi:hypothetical protein